MAPEVRGADRDHHDMTFAGADVLVAARAEVGLVRLVGLDPPDLHLFGGSRRATSLLGSHRVQPRNAQATRAAQTANATATMR
jgi:hypothetical protein